MAILGGIKRKWQGPAGTANTALEFHAGRLLALNEGDLPFAVRVLCEGAIESIGSVTMSGKLSHPCTAHPKAWRRQRLKRRNALDVSPLFCTAVSARS